AAPFHLRAGGGGARRGGGAPAPPAGAGGEPVLGTDDLVLLGFVAEGLSVEAMARRLAVSKRTVRRRTRAICDRLGVRGIVPAVVWAVRRGLL
ncbi:LuxR C-terminal-related transcriptional regulator, partial [Micromonospora sp. CPCC 205371]|nr:LuxR C-terminal-related transcriptional regulator [Micromonospora sp. CPCC 205371]